VNGKGFIKVPRELLNDWRDSLSMEEQGILINLMAKANYEDKPKRAPKGDLLQRGQLVTSIRHFAKEFNISEGKTRRLLDKWEKLGLIKRNTVSGTQSGTPSGTLLTLEFYEFSQGIQHTNRHRIQHKDGTPIRNKETDNLSPSCLNGAKVEEQKNPEDMTDAERIQQYSNITLTQ